MKICFGDVNKNKNSIACEKIMSLVSDIECDRRDRFIAPGPNLANLGSEAGYFEYR